MLRWIATFLLFPAFAAPLRGQDVVSAAAPPVPTIVTAGDATIRRAPDEAYLVAAVETRARTPRDAQQQNAAGMNAVLQRVTAAGIPRDAIRTLGYTIQQDVDFVNGRRVPKEYAARNAIEVRIDAIDRAGDIIDAAVQAGATSVDRLRFDLKNRATVEREALRLAVVDARARAEAAAAGAGVSVVRVLRVDDSRPPEYRTPMLSMARVATGDAIATPVEPGVIEIHATVSLTVLIK